MKLINILLFLFLFTVSPTHPKVDSLNLKKTTDQSYIDYLKEINQQSQSRFDSAISNYNTYLAVVSTLMAVFTGILIFITYLGFSEYRKITDQRKEFEKIISESNKTFTKEVRNRVRNLVLQQDANVLFRLKQYDLANETIKQIYLDDENDDFSTEVKLLSGRIKFYLGDYAASKRLFEIIMKSNLYSGNEYQFFFLDMIGANNHKLFNDSLDKRLIAESIDSFKQALKYTTDSYEMFRVYSNIQSSYCMLKEYSEAINIYENQTSQIQIGSHPKGAESVKNLIIDAKSTLIFAYWKTGNSKCYEIFEQTAEELCMSSNEIRQFLLERLNVDPDSVDHFLAEHLEYKSKLQA